MVYIVMGVSGCGKSSVGQLLAERLQAPFYDADDYHSENNIEKMSNGIALNDDDRRPWLLGLAERINSWHNQGPAVLACSALKQQYRDLLTSTTTNVVQFVYLQGSKALLTARLEGRKNHFMATGLLDSQLNTLEEPDDALIVSIDNTLDGIVTQIVKAI